MIAGSGLYDIPGLEMIETRHLKTPFGEPSDAYRIGRVSGSDIAFLPRHGSPHRIPPHRINYRANIWGFRELGVRRILSVGATGGISSAVQPGDIVLLDQLLDLTSGRESTYYDGPEVLHVDFTEPFCTELRERFFEASRRSDVAVVKRGTYICVNGPRLETAAEIRRYGMMGADVIGMTAMPEAILARELALCFSGIAVVTNAAAGLSAGRLTATEVVEGMHAATERLRTLVRAFFLLPAAPSACGCGRSLEDAKL